MSVDQDPTEVTRVASENDLGVIFDEKLVFRDHISKKARQANRNLGLIFRSFTYIDKAMFLNLYKSLVCAHLEHATSVQRRATRLVNALSGRTYEDRLKTLGLPTLEYGRLRADVIQVYKILNQIDRVDVDKFFTMSEMSTRGNSLKIFKTLRCSVFSNRVVDVWNSLPNPVVTAPSLNSFKSRLNKHWYGHELKFNASCYIPGETVFSKSKWVFRSCLAACYDLGNGKLMVSVFAYHDINEWHGQQTPLMYILEKLPYCSQNSEHMQM